jgi:DnaJ family protein C protein 3
LTREPENFDAIQGYQNAGEMGRLLNEAQYFVEMSDCVSAVEILSRIIDIVPWDAELRRMRSNCYMDLGDATHAVMDLRFTTKLNNDDTDGLYRLSSIQYQLGDVENSLKEIRECLKLDPEHKYCFPLYKKLKKLDKLITDAERSGQNQDYGECVDDIKKVRYLITLGNSF